MSTLNLARLNMVLDKYLETGSVGTVLETNRSETVMRPAGSGKVIIELGVSLQALNKEEMGSLEMMVKYEEPYLLLKGNVDFKLVISNLAQPRDVYMGYIEGYLGPDHDAGGLLASLEEAGWDLGTLALTTHGFVLQIEK